MKKKITALLLAVIMSCNMGSETLYATEARGVQQEMSKEEVPDAPEPRIETAQDSPIEDQPETGEQPGTEEKPETGEQPGTEEKPETGEQPGTEEKPETGEQPGTEGKPGTGEQPGTEGKPGTGEQPGTGSETDSETYKITFDMASGHLADNSKVAVIEVVKGTVPNAEEVEQPVRTGYAFGGWQDLDGAIYLFDQPVMEDITLTAIWIANTYYVHFDANGGKGSMEDEAFTYGTYKSLTSNKFTKTGYKFAGWNTKKDGTGNSYKNKQKIGKTTSVNNKVITLYAIWTGVSYTVKYDGNGATGGSVADSSHIYDTASKLNANKFTRKGYTFSGWTTNEKGTGTVYKDQAEVKTLVTKSNGSITLYAKWEKITYTIQYNLRGGKFAKTAKKSYTVTSSFTLLRPTRKGYDFDGWYKDKKFKKRIGSVTKGSTGNLTLYAKWVKCTGQGTTSSAKITSAKATGKNKVKISATIKKRVASSDDYYYLVYINPMNNKMYKAAAKTYKKNKISYTLKTTENQGYITSRFGIAIKKNGKYQLISNTSYVKNPEKAAANTIKYNPGKTKKGIQFGSGLESMAEVDDCDAKQVFLNVTVANVCNDGYVPYKYNGKTYYFADMNIYRPFVSECNKKGITVTMQIMLDWTSNTDLIHPSARIAGAAPYYTWNVYTNSAREKMEAIFCYLGMVFGQKDCYVSNWILGNEVNNPGSWNYAGAMSTETYFTTYAYAFRALYYAVKSQYSNAHVFICTDNYWNSKGYRRFSARETVEKFVIYLNSVQQGLQWNLAYHAYAYPIGRAKVWEGYGATNDIYTTPSVTMKNISTLTNYIKSTYGSSVRVILSEQGYSSSSYGETVQAAAIAYSYNMAACNSMVDAFIIRSYQDHPVEAAVGLNMGIKGKEAFDVYKYMDTSKAESYTNKYLSTIGASSWKSIISGYSTSRLKKMYRKT